MSEKSRDEAMAELEAQKAAVQMAESEVETAQLNFDYTKVKAPISGVTGMEGPVGMQSDFGYRTFDQPLPSWIRFIVIFRLPESEDDVAGQHG